MDDFTDQNNHEHRHIINFPETSEPEGCTNIENIDQEQFAYHDSWQFEISQDEDWRVHGVLIHGVLIQDTFYVIWLDPEHLLYARKNRAAAP